MLPVLHPLVHEDDDEHRGHHKIQAVGVKMDEASQDPAQSRSRDPVDVVEEGYGEHEPAAVNALRDPRGVVDGEGLVAHPEYEAELLPAHAAEAVKHGEPVEQVPCLYDKRHEERLRRRE